jgi:hypothetical protein
VAIGREGVRNNVRSKNANRIDLLEFVEVMVIVGPTAQDTKTSAFNTSILRLLADRKPVASDIINVSHLVYVGDEYRRQCYILILTLLAGITRKNRSEKESSM